MIKIKDYNTIFLKYQWGGSSFFLEYGKEKYVKLNYYWIIDISLSQHQVSFITPYISNVYLTFQAAVVIARCILISKKNGLASIEV